MLVGALTVLLVAQPGLTLSAGPVLANSDEAEVAAEPSKDGLASAQADAPTAAHAEEDAAAAAEAEPDSIDQATEAAEAELDSITFETARIGRPRTMPTTTGCARTLQAQIDAAPAGSTLTPAVCVYRETVTINKALTLSAAPGTEIRGSDVWSDWTHPSSYWVQGPLPAFTSHGSCQPGTTRCLWPEQVFVDGQPLEQVTWNPTAGQFAVDANRMVLLADDPRGHTVEVTTRTNWVVVNADHVSILGFTMKHAANDAQSGALTANGFSYLTVQGNTLSDAHGDAVAFLYGAGQQVLGNDVHHAGQTGIGSYKSTDVLVQGNKIHDNNTEEFDPNWEAGGLKMATVTRLRLDSNEVYNNAGPGLWCDISCGSVTYSHNKVHDNAGAGIFFEISNGAQIADNALWNNGTGNAEGWGSDVFVSSSSNAEVARNTILASRTHAILVVSQDRAGYSSVVNNDVHDNTVVMNGLYQQVGRTGLGWIQDWSGHLFDGASNNRGANNAFWFSYPQPSWERFDWSGARETLAAFSATPGGQNSRYLSLAERDQALTAAGIPLPR